MYSESKYSPSAPKSGLNDFFSLKFLNIFTTLLLSLIAYLNRDCIVKKSNYSSVKEQTTKIRCYKKSTLHFIFKS